MTLPICIEIPSLPDPLAITLPGGITMEHLNLMEVIQPALTPLVPLFNIIDAVVAAFNCIKAIPDTLGPPPDPTALAACIPKLAEKVNALLRLVPQLSLPYTVVGLVDLLIDSLRQARSVLLHLQQQMVQVTGVMDRAASLQDDGLLAIALCTEGNVRQEAANVGKSLASLGRLIGLLNLFGGLIGAPEVPDLSDLAGRPLDDVVPALNGLIDTLQGIRSAIPLP